jgi:plastocyanin
VFLPTRGAPASRAFLGALSGILLTLGCAQAPTPTPTPAPPPTAAATVLPSPVSATAVQIANFNFAPVAISVPIGATVTWTNADVEQHTVTARDKSFNSDVIANEKTFSFTFAKPGTYSYFCQIHPNMVGEVVVK